ncbi:MAG: hypothetical protein GXY03_13925 [Solirubrobacterales bacterium]|nr:hypothetical protein [Solirubrobacterales bacterium]
MRKLLLLAAAAIAAFAFSASAASAQGVEVSVEGGDHCSNFTMVDHEPVGATCTVRALSERPAHLWLHNGMAEVLFSECSNEFEAAFNEAGQGYIYNQILTPEGGICGREPCDESASGTPPHKNLAWPATLSEVDPNLILTVTFCLYAHSNDPATEGQPGTPCAVALQVTDEGTHDWEVGTPAIDASGNGGAPCTNLGGAVELDGHWLVTPNENHPDTFEVTHLEG